MFDASWLDLHLTYKQKVGWTDIVVVSLPSMQRTAMQSDQSAERRNTKAKEGAMLKVRERGVGKMYFKGAWLLLKFSVQADLLS